MKHVVCLSFILVFALYCLSYSQDSSASAPAQEEAVAPASAGVGDFQSFTVDSMAFAAGIESREPVGVTTEFPWDMGRVSCWIRISSSKAPVPVRFVWYKNGEVVREWLYSLFTESGRLWATKAVSTGHWKVEIVDAAKNVVKTASFVVKGR